MQLASTDFKPLQKKSCRSYFCLLININQIPPDGVVIFVMILFNSHALTTLFDK